MSAQARDPQKLAYCSFCLKNQDEAETIIAAGFHFVPGHQAFICDECVDLCVVIVREKRAGLAGVAAAYHDAMEAALGGGGK